MQTEFKVLVLLLTLLTQPFSAYASTTLPEDNSKAVILAYHRIGEDAFPQSNLSLEIFKEHVQELSNGSYTIMPIPDIIEAITTKQPLPPKTIGITFEGSFRSAYDNAMPLLLKQDIPFTIFIASEQATSDNHITWKNFKSLSKKQSVTLGILPAQYSRITALPEAEQKRQINKARKAFKDNIGSEAKLFSYPFGEISNTLKNIVKSQNFDAAFGLHSGTTHPASDINALPRFTMTDQYGDLERLRLVTNALPLPIIDIEPSNLMISDPEPSIGFTVDSKLEPHLSTLSCFVSGQDKPNLEILGTRIELRLQEPLFDNKTRVNCTLPGPKNENDERQWRWFGMVLHRATE